MRIKYRNGKQKLIYIESYLNLISNLKPVAMRDFRKFPCKIIKVDRFIWFILPSNRANIYRKGGIHFFRSFVVTCRVYWSLDMCENMYVDTETRIRASNIARMPRPFCDSPLFCTICVLYMFMSCTCC